MKQPAVFTAMAGLVLSLVALAQPAYAQANPLLDEDFWKTATIEDATVAIIRGLDILARDKNGNTPLHMAAGRNHNPGVTEFLIDRGADIEARTKSGNTPLHMAAEHNHNPDVVGLLLDRGSDIQARETDTGNTPLHAASCCNDNPEVARLLLEYGASLDAVNHDNKSPVDMANENPKTRAMALFLIRYMKQQGP